MTTINFARRLLRNLWTTCHGREANLNQKVFPPLVPVKGADPGEQSPWGLDIDGTPWCTLCRMFLEPDLVQRNEPLTQ
jgi:hypothetical protein